jgi:hypothetical protein
MTVFNGRGRHRLPKRRFPRALAAALLVVLLTAVPAVPTGTTAADRQAAYATIEER